MGRTRTLASRLTRLLEGLRRRIEPLGKPMSIVASRDGAPDAVADAREHRAAVPNGALQLDALANSTSKRWPGLRLSTSMKTLGSPNFAARPSCTP